ncbi:hypothetical protein QJQ45_028656 [Haematococcus lacustris]|nr:hypothetical protein QJQ45_028656 [Haematococcus lacustris]
MSPFDKRSGFIQGQRLWHNERHLPGPACPPSQSSCSVLPLRLPDAHCHPQQGPDSQERLQRVQAPAVAVMGVSEGDWERVLELQRALPRKQLGLLDLPQGTDRDQEAVRQLLASCPSVTWAGRLRQLLTEVPGAVLGECGLDRAAVVPGTKASQSLPHQLSLLRTQLALAAQLQRPASLHCVRATGHMMALLSSTPSEELPPRIMLHSFNGPPDSIKQLLALPRGVGSRLYFSFSATINARSGAGRDKLVARIRAVPQDRLLAETDEDDAGRMDAALGAVLQLVAEARGWTAEQATELLTANFEAFYDSFLPPGYVMQRRVQAGPEAAPKNPALGHIVVCALYAMQLEEKAAIESQKRWGTRKQLVVFFGNPGIDTRGGSGAKAVLQACRKVVERPNSGKPTDRVPGKVVTVDEFRTSRVSSAMNSPQPCEVELERSKPTRLEGWKPQPGQVQNRFLRWVDRDCNAALNMQRAGESMWRPLELCRWPHRARLPAKGKEYPALGFKKRRDRAPKALAQQPVAQ